VGEGFGLRRPRNTKKYGAAFKLQREFSKTLGIDVA
jgi:hypothetical protein